MEALPYLQSISLKKDKIQSFERYPFSIPAVRELSSLHFGKNVTIFVGENGSGKSTLLEAIAVSLGFNAEGGTRNFNFSTRTTHSELHRHLKLSKSFKQFKDGFFLRAESFYNVASNIEDIDDGTLINSSYGGKSLHAQSHGESFLSLMMNRFGGNGLYLLDEPEAALSPSRQLSVLSRMFQLIGQNSQFIIATHSPILMAYPNALIYQIDRNGIHKVNYVETEHYEITKAFLNNPNPMLRELFKHDDT
ncbi:ATP-binding cassette domain-containing protein [Alteromonas sp. ZYF713]|uniref:AAA family ATPase n=1 Tax=Alteromonas gracilis TaxID=1479524 RepID=UPI002434331B|nr:ATP-binding cassette domain-containing protein [Alteromonas sp. ZYF713]